MKDYTFSLAESGDLPEILELYHSLIGTPGCTWHAGYPDRETAAADIRDESLYILKDKNRIISVASAGTSGELDGLDWNADNLYDLARIGVVSDMQHKGIGALMLRNVIDEVKTRGFSGIRMLVSKANPHALAMYDRSGFAKRGEARMYGIDFYCYEMIF